MISRRILYLLLGFGNLRNDKELTNVTLAFEDGQQLEAHKVILACSSPLFEKILQNSKLPHSVIYLRGFQSKDFVSILDFLYFGEANVFQEDLDSFLAITEEIQLKGLTDQTSKDLIHEQGEFLHPEPIQKDRDLPKQLATLPRSKTQQGCSEHNLYCSSNSKSIKYWHPRAWGEGQINDGERRKDAPCWEKSKWDAQAGNLMHLQSVWQGGTSLCCKNSHWAKSSRGNMYSMWPLRQDLFFEKYFKYPQKQIPQIIQPTEVLQYIIQDKTRAKNGYSNNCFRHHYYPLIDQEVWKVEITIFSSCRLQFLFANLTFLSLLTRSSHFRPICSLLCISFAARDRKGANRESISLLIFSCLVLFLGKVCKWQISGMSRLPKILNN